MADRVVTFSYLAGRKVPSMRVVAHTLDALAQELEHRLRPTLGNRLYTVHARRDGTVTVTTPAGARIGTGVWRDS